MTDEQFAYIETYFEARDCAMNGDFKHEREIAELLKANYQNSQDPFDDMKMSFDKWYPANEAVMDIMKSIVKNEGEFVYGDLL